MAAGELVAMPTVRISSKRLVGDFSVPKAFVFSDKVDKVIAGSPRTAAGSPRILHPRDTFVPSQDVVQWKTHSIYREHPLMFMLMEKEPMIYGFVLEHVEEALGKDAPSEQKTFRKKFTKFVNVLRGPVFPWLPKANADCVLPRDALTDARMMPLFLFPLLRFFIDDDKKVDYEIQMDSVGQQIYQMSKQSSVDPTLMTRTHAQFLANQAAARQIVTRELSLSNLELSKRVKRVEDELEALKQQHDSERVRAHAVEKNLEAHVLGVEEYVRALKGGASEKRSRSADGRKGKKTKRHRA